MKKVWAWVLSGMLMGLTLWGDGRAAGIETDQGKILFNDKCQLCHGKRGEGNGPAAAAFSPSPANFTDPKFWQNFNDAKIEDTIRKGHGMMPAFDLTSDQIKAIIDYLEHTFKKEKG